MTVTAYEVDAVYRSQRLRLANVIAARVAQLWASEYRSEAATLGKVIPVVEDGQRRLVAIVEAYMAAKALQQTGDHAAVGILNPADYVTSLLRKVDAAHVYSRPFGAFYANLNSGADQKQALTSALASLDKLVRTDLQLTQTHAARDWMNSTERIVGWRRVLNGDHSCALCTAASTRTYRKSDLMPIHEHCDCTVEPLWGEHAVASIGTTVRVENDPELGPRLMADGWSSVGPRIR